MKKLFCFLAVASTALFTSCSSDDDNNNNNGGGGNNGVTAITLTSNVPTLELGKGSFTFKVADQTGKDVTSGSTITVNEVAIDNNTWTPTTDGTFTVKATYGSLSSSTVVTVTPAVIVEPDPEIEDNTFVYDGEVYNTDESLFVYLGTTANNINGWVAAAIDSETGASFDLYFASPQDPNSDSLIVPEVGNFTYIGATPTGTGTFDAVITKYYNSDEDFETVGFEGLIQSLNLNLSSMNLTSGTTGNWTYDYKLTLTNGDVIPGKFSGNWEFVNAAPAPTAKGAKLLSIKDTKVNRVSLTEMNKKAKSLSFKK